MSKEKHVSILVGDGVATWNLWRKDEPAIRPDLSGANLFGADLTEADLSGADLSNANLMKADLSGVDLGEANLFGAKLAGATLSGANLFGADLTEADLTQAHLSQADLTQAHLIEANLTWADFDKARLTKTNLSGANLSGANFSGAKLTGADLSRTICVQTKFSDANLTGCTIYGIAAWELDLHNAVQANLRITREDEPAITVDNLEVAQFLYLLLHNQQVRALLDTITSKVVLLLGRFGERKPTLDALREALRHHTNGYIPVLFDFEPQRGKPVLETVKTLANLARFIIADLTDPRMIRSELTAIIPNVPTVPVQPIVQGNADIPTEFASWSLYRSFLPVYRYLDVPDLLASLTEKVIEPAETHVHARRLVDV